MNNTNTTNYICRVALAENIEAGFVWLSTPKIESRTIVRIINHDNSQKVYCQSLNIDQNFCSKYNKGKKKTTINEENSYIVTSKWYRDKLGIEKNKNVSLEVKTANSKIENMWWAYQAAKKHPENAVRLSTRIASISLFLGVLSILLAIIASVPSCSKKGVTNIANVDEHSEVLEKLDEIEKKILLDKASLLSLQENQKNIQDRLSHLSEKITALESKLDTKTELKSKEKAKSISNK